MNETVITVVGNVVREPSLRVTNNGTRVVDVRLASTERRYDKALGAWRDGETIFYTVTCWRNVAENLMDSVEKGQPLVVHGKLRDGSYEKDGQWHTDFKIDAYALGHDISRGVSRFTKASVSSGRGESATDDSERSGLSAVRSPEEEAEGDEGESLSPSAA